MWVIDRAVYILTRPLLWMIGCTLLQFNAHGEEMQENNTSKSELSSKQDVQHSNEMPKVEQIKINVHPIFDENNPKENNFLYRFVNRIHINTKEHVIKKELTFKEGEKLDKHLIQESERRLRSRRYLDDAKITVSKKSGESGETSGQIVNVDVHEVWTMVPKLTYSTSGGNTHYGYGLHDSNFLGLGKTVKVEHTSTEMRTGDLIVYRDPNFMGHSDFELGYADNSDGKATEFNLVKPFASVLTTWAGGVNYLDYLQEDTLYNAGDEVARFSHDATFKSFSYGKRLGFSNVDRIHHLTLGIDDAEDYFAPIPTETSPVPGYLPYDREYQVAWLSYSYVHNKFYEAKNIQQINRTEDINLGSELIVRLGRVSGETEQLDKSLQTYVSYNKSFRLTSRQLLELQMQNSGYYKRGEISNALSSLYLGYHWQNFDKGQLFLMVNENHGKNLFADKPLELGGDTGLRGYPARFVAGDKSRIFTVEQRYYGETEWLSLFHMGAAVFFDEAKVWGNSAVPQDYQRTLRDVGVGLRISGTRTGGRNEGGHNITHIDIAYPLDGGDEIDRYQFSVSIKTSF